jgi:hypothetical protein
MTPTPYPDLNEVLREWIDGVREVLGDGLVGAWLQGSFAMGAADEHSDVDFVVAVGERLQDPTPLQQLHGRIFDLPCPWAQHLEGSYFPVDVLRDWKRNDEAVWFLDHGARELTRSTHCNTAVVRETLREHGIALAGPHAHTLIDPVPEEAVSDEILRAARVFGTEILETPEPYENLYFQGYIVLSFCRYWCDFGTRELGSKQRAAEWAKQRLDAEWHDVIDRAWTARPDPATSMRTPVEPEEFRRTQELVRLVMGKLGVE